MIVERREECQRTRHEGDDVTGGAGEWGGGLDVLAKFSFAICQQSLVICHLPLALVVEIIQSTSSDNDKWKMAENGKWKME
jgi:hypothetical protein